MECINFDKQFQKYMAVWMKENAEKYKDNIDEIEAMMPDVYMEYLEKPADWLGGIAPAAYFEQYDDADMLVQWLCEYEEKKIPVPDMLMDRITDLGVAAEDALFAQLTTGKLPQSTEMTVISMLRELESVRPMALYIGWIAAAQEGDDRADLCAEAIVSMGDAAIEPILAVLDGATENGRDIFADILSNYPGDDRIFALLCERFANAEGKKALFASYFEKYGDERALPMLEEAAQSPEIGYLDYVEIVNAIEALGGDRPPEREFAGDPYYESLRRVED